MKPVTNLKIAMILLVTLVSAILTYPTVVYYLHLQSQPALTDPKPLTKTPEPDAAKADLHAAWEKENPEFVAWVKAHPDYVAWEKKSADLLASAIPLGLDLRGGVDVTLRIDENKLRATELDRAAGDIESALKLKQISPTIVKGGDGNSIKVQVDVKDSPAAAEEIKKHLGTIEGDASAQALATGATFTLRMDSFKNQLSLGIEGAQKSISERVDKLGVTQPKVTKQGEDRIRIQVPGEKDPENLISNVIRPADLQLKLVLENNGELIRQALDAEGNPDPSFILPAGADLVQSLSGHFDQAKQQMVYDSSYLLLNNRAELTGADLARAYFDIDPNDINGDPVKVILEFKGPGTAKFADLTKHNTGRRLAIILDGTVRSAPVLEVPILDGRASIHGGFTIEEARDLSMILKAGSLPAPLTVESKHTVGASLGAGAIKQGVNALVLGTIAVTVFMISYYGTAGVIAVLAMFLHILMITGIMALSKATLTLSGIGGILLTIGMAVDANVLIYERVREELKAGRPLRQAFGIGYQRAFGVIFDANVATLISALVLLQFTDGSVFGFALTMVFGLLANFYTGFTVTYTLCALWIQWRGSLSLGRIQIPATNFRFIRMRWLSFSLAVLVFLGGAAGLVARGGFSYGVDFMGGVMAEVTLGKGGDADKIREALAAADLKDVRVQAVTDKADTYLLDTRAVAAPADYKPADGAGTGEAAYTEVKIRQALETGFGPGGSTIGSVATFGSETSQTFVKMALSVTFLACAAILLYLWFRFELVFGVGAIISLIHDLFIVVVLTQLWDVQITLEVVAALMVLLGFSVNDTIVIYDRIRENCPLMPHESFEKVCDDAMNQSLARTLITSTTLWLTAVCLLLVGGEGLASFAKVLVIGCIVGTYSSDFLAAPMVYQWDKFRGGAIQRMLSTKRKKKRSEAQPIRAAAPTTRPAPRPAR